MSNTSATGGPLIPFVSPAPLEGSALLDLIQETLVGLTGIDTTLVRPRFQVEPPDIPDEGTCWMSFGITSRPSDTFPVILHDGAANSGLGQDNLQRQEILKVLCSLYDDGSSGNAYNMAAQLRDGLAIPQNIEALTLGGQIELGYTGELIILPSLVKKLWLFRVDLEIEFRRQVNRSYPILNLDSAEVDFLTGNLKGIGEFVIGVDPIGGVNLEKVIIER